MLPTMMGISSPDYMADICVVSVITACLIFTLLYRSSVRKESDIFARDDTLSASPLFDDAADAGDDVGDDFLQEIGYTKVYESLTNKVSLLEIAATSGPAGAEFLKRFTEVPSWVDLEAVRRGQAFQRQWVEVMFSTGLASLIESYGYSNGAQILVETGRLACCGDAHKRALETATFNLDLIEHGVEPWTPQAQHEGRRCSRGLDSIARVRMLHCMVRRHVRSSCPWWNSSRMGVPVSQEDGAHTVFHNSHTALCGMQNVGLPISERDKDGVSMFWAHVG
jgi:hypothetical protein